MVTIPCIRFRRRVLIETAGPEALISDAQRQQRERGRREAALAGPAAGMLDRDSLSRLTAVRAPAWYGADRGLVFPYSERLGADGWPAVGFTDEVACRLPPESVDFLPARPLFTTGALDLVPLTDAPLGPTLVDPERHLFRHPDEAGFWDRIVADYFDATARLVYADWLDEGDDPHAWAFREPTPFLLGSFRMGWVEAMGRVDCGAPGRRTLWGFAGVTGRGAWLPFSLSDGTPLPQFVAYLLAVTRIRADRRLSDPDRTLLADQTRALGLSLVSDLILGPDDRPVCRVTDPVRTIYLLGELLTEPAGGTTAELVARLRRVNGSDTSGV